MAFNWSTFWTRAFTALIFVAVMMTGILYNQWSFFLLFAIIHCGCWWEFFKLVDKIHQTTTLLDIKFGLILLGFHFLVLVTGDHLMLGQYLLSKSLSLPLLVAGIILLLMGIFKQSQLNWKYIGQLFSGLLYISLSLGLFILLCFTTIEYHLSDTMFLFEGPLLPLFIMGSIWINDTMAYLVGSVIGKTPLSKISPKKTWEGTIGGMILSASVTWLLYSLLFLDASVNTAFAPIGIIISATVAIFGTIGDLYESKLKRMAGVKDSGRIMPGHGGFLDRFDSLLFAVPFAFVIILLLTKIFAPYIP